MRSYFKQKKSLPSTFLQTPLRMGRDKEEEHLTHDKYTTPDHVP
ncbi:MAG: hypothetical protein NZT61_00470 [Deltaproteobacteria bacterium]|nr:hypothetical protein [Deltaproteobacteria bacterium]MCX7953228.1 hypothetical protein [Deltaproteobacteria bacterium]